MNKGGRKVLLVLDKRIGKLFGVEAEGKAANY
jgi:hypothetical protein